MSVTLSHGYRNKLLYGASSAAYMSNSSSNKKNNRITSTGTSGVHRTTGVASITLGYDELKRLKTETAVKESATVYTKSYSYRDSSATAGRTTLQVSDVTVKDKNNVTVLSRHYNYNGCGDITSVTDGTSTLASYTYNNLQQLTAETQNYTKYSSSGVGTSATYTAAYTYDTGGNILTASKTMPGSTAVTHTYTYGDSRWADLLTAYDGHSLTYDEIGNPTSYYNGTSYTMSWVQGRRLETIQTGNTTITFAYDMDGVRRSKTVVTDTSTTRTTTETSYITQSGLIIQQTTVKTVLTKSTNTTTTSTRILEFSYDSQQRPFCVLDRYTQASGKYSETRYYYVLNLQGDVVALMTGSGTVWARYTYDAWGKQLQVLNGENKPLGSTSDYFANANPFRYRGYYCDVETGFYYLQSRYYDPQIGRFINADAAEVVTLSTAHLNDTNLFVYCRDNPVSHGDDDGNFINTVIGAVVSGVVAAVTTDRDDPNYVEKVFLGAFCGAISGLTVDIAIATAGVAVPLTIAALGGGASGAINSAATQKMDTGSIDWGIVVIDAVVGAAMNTLSYGVSIPQSRVTSGGNIVTRIVQNSKNAVQADALKVVTSRFGKETVRRANYNTIIAKNVAASYATSGITTFGGWAFSRNFQLMWN